MSKVYGLLALALSVAAPPEAALAFSPPLDAGQETNGAGSVPGVPALGSPAPGVGSPALQGGSVLPAIPQEPGSTGAVSSPEPGLDGLPRILRSEAEMPEPVRQMRARLLEAARSGDMGQLRSLMEAQPQPPSVSLGDPGDPIEYLKALSSDAEGREILAILLELLGSGFVRSQPGTSEELYVWPYFAQYPLEALTPSQLVELFTLLTAADYEEMRSYGSYTFFRVGIAPDGRWLFFLAGD